MKQIKRLLALLLSMVADWRSRVKGEKMVYDGSYSRNVERFRLWLVSGVNAVKDGYIPYERRSL